MIEKLLREILGFPNLDSRFPLWLYSILISFAVLRLNQTYLHMTEQVSGATLIRGAMMKVLIILCGIYSVLSWNAVTNSEAKAFYDRCFAQIKSSQNGIKHEPYMHIMFVCSMINIEQNSFFFWTTLFY